MEQNRSRKICRNSNKKRSTKEKIYLEKESTNTGDNFRFTKKIIEKANLKIKTCIVVCKPYGEKRVYAAFKKILPEYKVSIYSENTSYEEYYKSHNKEWINVLVGDIQRMELFYQKGWQIKMKIPQNVIEAYQELIKKGYDKYVLKDIKDEGDKKNIEKILNKVL